MNAIMREEIIHKYHIEDLRGLSVSEIFGLIFIDLANTMDENNLVKPSNPNQVEPEYKNYWIDKLIFMWRNGYNHYRNPDTKSVTLDGIYMTATLAPHKESLEIKCRDKINGLTYCNYIGIKDCTRIINFAGATPS